MSVWCSETRARPSSGADPTSQESTTVAARAENKNRVLVFFEKDGEPKKWVFVKMCTHLYTGGRFINM